MDLNKFDVVLQPKQDRLQLYTHLWNWAGKIELNFLFSKHSRNIPLKTNLNLRSYVIFFRLQQKLSWIHLLYLGYNKPIPKIWHVKTLQNLCNEIQKNNKKVRNKLLNSNVDCEAIRVRITLKFGSLRSFMIRNAFP